MAKTLAGIHADRTALVLLDLEQATLSKVPHADSFLDRVHTAVEAARRSGAVVAYVRTALDDEDFADLSPKNRTDEQLARTGKAVQAGSPQTEFDDRVAPERGDVVVRKTRVGAFSTTDLDDQLRARGVDTLALVGVATSGVVLSTVRDAGDRDYRILVLRDVTADTDQDVQKVLINQVLPEQAEVVTVDDFVRALLPAAPRSRPHGT